MMGRRQKLKSGDDYDFLYWRRVLCVFDKAGVSQKNKRRLNKRWRKDLKKELERELDDVNSRDSFSSVDSSVINCNSN
jgi:hypothetical protein